MVRFISLFLVFMGLYVLVFGFFCFDLNVNFMGMLAGVFIVLYLVVAFILCFLTFFWCVCWFLIFVSLYLLMCGTCSVILRGFIVLFLCVLGCIILDFVCLFFLRFSMLVDWFSFILCFFPFLWIWARPVGRARFRFVHFSFISCFGLVCVWCVMFWFWVPLMMFWAVFKVRTMVWVVVSFDVVLFYCKVLVCMCI